MFYKILGFLGLPKLFMGFLNTPWMRSKEDDLPISNQEATHRHHFKAHYVCASGLTTPYNCPIYAISIHKLHVLLTGEI